MVPILSTTGAFLNVPRCLRASASDGGAARSVSVMAELKSRLRADLTDAMKAKDKLRTATLRMLLAAIQTEEVSGKEARELSDDEVLKVLAKEARKRGEAAEIYTQNGRGELAANEHAEARVIDEYLPTPPHDPSSIWSFTPAGSRTPARSTNTCAAGDPNACRPAAANTSL